MNRRSLICEGTSDDGILGIGSPKTKIDVYVSDDDKIGRLG